MKVLVTGSLGLVGSACVKLFEEKGWDVVGIDNNGRSDFFKTPRHEHGYASYDIRDVLSIAYLFNAHKFDAVIHAAAQPSHDYSKDHVIEDFEVNTMGTLNLLEATRKWCPEAVFVYVSTDKVYGENMNRPELEEQPTRYHSDMPFNEFVDLDTAGIRSPFGCSKLAADLYVQEYGNLFGMYTACFRPGCITGKAHEGAELHGFLAYLAKCIRTGQTYNVFGYKGKQVRDQIHAYDLANAFWHFIQKPKRGAVYNIGGGPDRSVSVIEAAQMIEKETGKKATLLILPEERQGDRIWDVHDVSKFRKDYPEWDYQYSLSDIIKDVCEKAL